jgi:hypothetical protein
VREKLPNTNNFGIIWRVPFEKRFKEEKIAAELSEGFSEDSSD